MNCTPIPLREIPDLVVMMITPFAARAPYKAAAVLPFNTEIFSISSGFNAERPSPPSFPPQRPACPKLLVSMGTPFTTYNGWSFPPKEEPPRMITRVDPAAPDAGGDTFTPAILPVRAFPTFAVRTSCTISPLIC